MFHPTIVRIATRGEETGMVVMNGANEDSFFQVYQEREDNHTYMLYNMPWGDVSKAIDDFTLWLNTGAF